jgi:hypothetical protein
MIYKFLFEALLFVILIVVYYYLDFKLMDKVEEIVKPYGEEVLKKVYKCIGKAQLLVVLFGVLYIILINYDTWSEPTAIDVYRGQTKLEINYENGVPQDTIVVWKK